MPTTGAVDLAALLDLDRQQAEAPYEKLRRGVIDLIEDGRLLVGERIPTVRGLAEALSLAPNTVARAYRELESEGFIETRGRHGSFIKAGPDAAMAAAERATVAHVNALRAMGIGDEAMVALLQRAVRSV